MPDILGEQLGVVFRTNIEKQLEKMIQELYGISYAFDIGLGSTPVSQVRTPPSEILPLSAKYFDDYFMLCYSQEIFHELEDILENIEEEFRPLIEHCSDTQKREILNFITKEFWFLSISTGVMPHPKLKKALLQWLGLDHLDAYWSIEEYVGYELRRIFKLYS